MAKGDTALVPVPICTEGEGKVLIKRCEFIIIRN